MSIWMAISRALVSGAAATTGRFMMSYAFIGAPPPGVRSGPAGGSDCGAATAAAGERSSTRAAKAAIATGAASSEGDPVVRRARQTCASDVPLLGHQHLHL